MKKIISTLVILAAGLTSCADGSMSGDEFAAPSSDDFMTEAMAIDYDQVQTENADANANHDVLEEQVSGSPTSTESFNYADKVIREAYMSIEVDDYKVGMDKLRLVMETVDGYISNEYEYYSGSGVSNDITIRVASSEFDHVVQEITDIATLVLSKTVNSTDVTEEYIDLESRMRSKEELLERYYELLAQSTTISDILNMESQIEMVNQELEIMKGRLKYLTNRTSYSTITLSVRKQGEEPYMEATATFGDHMGDAFEAGFSAVQFVLVALIYVWPVLVLLGLTLLTVKVVRARRA